jgi:hypothetical protein
MFTAPLTIDFTAAPTDPIERLMWLSGAREAFDQQLAAEFQKAYFDARRTARFDVALGLHLHSKKRALAMTRHENEARGRMLKWRDSY